MATEELAALRIQVDALDEQLVDLLARRFQATEAIGRLKAAARLPAVDAARESSQERRIADLAARRAVDPVVVHRVFRTIVDAVVANHEAIAASDRH